MFLRISRNYFLQLILNNATRHSVNENDLQILMILQSNARTLRDLLATEGGSASHLSAVRDTLILAEATAFTPPKNNTVSNNRTFLPNKKR
jgi:hypothetical protein